VARPRRLRSARAPISITDDVRLGGREPGSAGMEKVPRSFQPPDRVRRKRPALISDLVQLVASTDGNPDTPRASTRRRRPGSPGTPDTYGDWFGRPCLGFSATTSFGRRLRAMIIDDSPRSSRSFHWRDLHRPRSPETPWTSTMRAAHELRAPRTGLPVTIVTTECR
jgi:hypothetical protein